ncbi:MAG TPA: hypothetical protein VMZ27_05920, partial [Candidatus Saccharimonadales bacterium]|nr:hypothetical protein [Candidatus Saccharimonadales bacterium]
MVAQANQNGSGFVPNAGQPYCVLVAPTNGVQPLVLEFICRQAGLSLGSPQKMAGNSVRFQLFGKTGSNYVLQYSTNWSQWKFLKNVTATNDVMTITDTNSGELRKVYRAMLP